MQSTCQLRIALEKARNARNPTGDAQMRDAGQDNAAAAVVRHAQMSRSRCPLS